MIVTALLTVSACVLQFIDSKPLPLNRQFDGQIDQRDVEIAMDYLRHYGYIHADRMSSRKLKKGIKRFQKFQNLLVTGKLDDDTIRIMKLPRCGMKDMNSGVLRRTSRFSHHGTKWKKNLLTWRYTKETKDLDRDTVRRTLQKAMDTWSSVTNIAFQETDDSNADIDIRFVTGEHGDEQPFDGPGNVLSHAFYPLDNKELAGDIHFDDDEKYTLSCSEGKNLYWVAVHDVGHLLGLRHSPVKTSVMHPTYTGCKESLDEDDILGIQGLYGINDKKRKESTATNPPSNLYSFPEFTAMWRDEGSDKLILATRNKDFYELGVDQHLQANNFQLHCPPLKPCPQTIDAAFSTDLLTTDRNEYTAIFSADSYYLFKNFEYVSGPHSIHAYNGDSFDLNIPKWIRRIDAVMHTKYKTHLYIFSGFFYWIYDVRRKKFYEYPYLMYRHWSGVPKQIDAAYNSPQKTLFIKDNQLYMLQKGTNQVSQRFEKIDF